MLEQVIDVLGAALLLLVGGVVFGAAIRVFKIADDVASVCSFLRREAAERAADRIVSAGHVHVTIGTEDDESENGETIPEA